MIRTTKATGNKKARPAPENREVFMKINRYGNFTTLLPLWERVSLPLNKITANALKRGT